MRIAELSKSEESPIDNRIFRILSFTRRQLCSGESGIWHCFGEATDRVSLFRDKTLAPESERPLNSSIIMCGELDKNSRRQLEQPLPVDPRP